MIATGFLAGFRGRSAVRVWSPGNRPFFSRTTPFDRPFDRHPPIRLNYRASRFSILRPSHIACAQSQIACARAALPSQLICVENCPRLRVRHISIARRYTYQVSSNGATMDATASPTAPAATGTAFVGGEFKVGIFWYEMECGFTISGGSGTCNAPTPSPFVSSGNGGSPKCTVESVQQTDTCKYTVNFKMTLP